MPSVLIIHDSVLIRKGLRYIFEQEYRGMVLGEAKNDDSALTHLSRRVWDLIILEIHTSYRGDFLVLRNVRECAPAARVLVIGPGTEYLYALRAQQLGAAGYVGADAVRDELIRAIRDVLAGKEHFEGLQLSNNAGELLVGLSDLSPREHQIMLALRDGKRPIDIAAELNLNIKTVSTYKRRVLNKLQLNSVADLVRHTMQSKMS